MLPNTSYDHSYKVLTCCGKCVIKLFYWTIFLTLFKVAYKLLIGASNGQNMYVYSSIDFIHQNKTNIN